MWHGLQAYRATLTGSRRRTFERYRPADVAFKLVGTGSVGTRDYVVRLRAAMRGAIERHRSLNRALDSLPPVDEGRPVSLHSRERRNANRVYLEVEKELMGLEP